VTVADYFGRKVSMVTILEISSTYQAPRVAVWPSA